MIGIAGREYRTHEQPLYVNGVAIDQVWVNGRMVYPEVSNVDLIKISGHIDVSTDHTHYTPGYVRGMRWEGSPYSFYGEDYDNPFSVSFHMRASFVCVVRDRRVPKFINSGWPYERNTRNVSEFMHRYQGEEFDPEMHPSAGSAYGASDLIFGCNHYGVYKTIVVPWGTWAGTEYLDRECDLMLKYEMDPIPLCKRVNVMGSADRYWLNCYKMLQDYITWPCTRNNEVIHLTGHLAGPLTDNDDNAGFIYPAGESSGDKKLRVTIAGALNTYKTLDEVSPGYDNPVWEMISGLNMELIDIIPYRMWEIDPNSPKDGQGRLILTEPTNGTIQEQEMVIDDRIGFAALPPVPVTKIDYIGHEADAPEWAKNVYETDLYDFGGGDSG